MNHRYLLEMEYPSYDSKITHWLHNQPTEVDSIPYKIALWHDERFYRSITCSGLGEYVQVTNFLESICLKKFIAPDATFRGYDAVFVTLADHKKGSQARKKHS
jgi:hypothetical protein